MKNLIHNGRNVVSIGILLVTLTVGLTHAENVEFYENGKVKTISTYDGGERWWVEEYDENENLRKATYYEGILGEPTESIVDEYDKNGNQTKRSIYGSDGKLMNVTEYDKDGKETKRSIYGSDGKLMNVTEYDKNDNRTKMSEYSEGTFVRNMLETVECVYGDLLTSAMLIRDAATHDEVFERKVESWIWRVDNSLPSALKQEAVRAGYKFIGIKNAEKRYNTFRYYNGAWFRGASK